MYLLIQRGELVDQCVCLTESVKPSSSPVVSDAAELYAVLDTAQMKQPKTPLPVCGPELAAGLKIGTRVVRGVDWKWGDQVVIVITQMKQPKTPLPVCGPELAARLKIGTRVVQGVDWKWGDQVDRVIGQACCYACCSL